MTLKAFAPSGAPTAKISATIASASVAIDQSSAAVRVMNAGPNIAFLKFSYGASTATITDMPIAVGATEVFTVATNNVASAICETGTASVYFTNGEGL